MSQDNTSLENTGWLRLVGSLKLYVSFEKETYKRDYSEKETYDFKEPTNRSRTRPARHERWGAGVETQKNVRGEIGGWGRVPFNETYAPSLSTIYNGA